MIRHTPSLVVWVTLGLLVQGCGFERTSPEARKPASSDDTPSVSKKQPSAQPWPSFRGLSASGVADGQSPPTAWDAEKGTNIRWKTRIPGLGHSCPIVWGDRIFVTTAISGDPKAGLRPGHYGNIESVDDSTVHVWKIYCLNKNDGTILWERTAHKGVPQVKRHLKGTHANSTPATDGKHVVACFGSEGICCCYDFEGNRVWKIDLGKLDSGFFRAPKYQWGFGSSPIIYRDMAIFQCDLAKDSFIAACEVSTGKEVWRTPREEVASWGTPTIVQGPERTELVTNASAFVRGYNPRTGKELWRLAHDADITVPTPVAGHGLIYVMSGKGRTHPIFAVRQGAIGDISLESGSFVQRVRGVEQEEWWTIPADASCLRRLSLHVRQPH